MNQQERLDLKKLIQYNNYEDNTRGIRELKHSDAITADITKLEKLKKKHADLLKSDESKFMSLCQSECSFLFQKYTDIFNRIIKGQLDLGLMTQSLVILKKIENGEIDQQEGSVIMGKILHKIFVESALQHNANESNDNITTPVNNGKNMTWSEYKKKNLNY